MSFENNLGGIRAWGREMVLPTERIKGLLQTELFRKHTVNKIIDFGAGTLYCSKWFQTAVPQENIYPVDVIFHGLDEYEGMKCYSSIDALPKETLEDEGLLCL